MLFQAIKQMIALIVAKYHVCYLAIFQTNNFQLKLAGGIYVRKIL